MSGNLGNLPSFDRYTVSQEMYAFDNLPPVLREAYREFPVQASAADAYVALARGMTISAILKRMEEIKKRISKGELDV